jgi:hypothetical protein
MLESARNFGLPCRFGVMAIALFGSESGNGRLAYRTEACHGGESRHGRGWNKLLGKNDCQITRSHSRAYCNIASQCRHPAMGCMPTSPVYFQRGRCLTYPGLRSSITACLQVACPKDVRGLSRPS